MTLVPVLLNVTIYLISIAIVLNFTTAGSAFVIIEVPMGKGNRGEVPPASTEPAST